MIRSVGEILRSQREKRHLSLQEVNKTVKIHPTYLRALEEDNYKVFDGKVHAKGFLRIYAEFLGLDAQEILALWRREYEPFFDPGKKDVAEPKKKFTKPVLVLTPFNVIATLFSLVVLTFFGYVYYQYRSYTGNPFLEVTTPQDNLIQSTDNLDVTGRTDLDSQIYLNGQELILNPNGSFAASIKLKEGINTLSVTSVSKLGKKAEIVRTVIYRVPDEGTKLPVEFNETTASSQSSQSL